MKIHVKDKLFTIAISLFIGISVYYSFNALLKSNFNAKLNNDIKLALSDIENKSHDVLSTLSSLNKLPSTVCDDALLIEMRRQLFLSHFVKDIGFIKDEKITCTTGLGILADPVIDGPADYIDTFGAQVWANKNIILFDEKLAAIVVRQGSFNAVLDKYFLKDLLPHNFDWELVFHFDDNTFHLIGEQGVFAQSKQGEYGENTINRVLCSNKVPYCIAVSVSEKAFDSRYHFAQSVTLLVALLAVIIALLISNQIRIKYRSNESRVIRGLQNGKFYCLYQPIVELSTGNIIGCEVLARYKDAEGEIYPDVFIPIISRLDRTWSFTQSIIQRTLRDARTSFNSNQPFKININFFPQDIASEKILSLLEMDLMIQKNIKFVIEVTEEEELTQSNCAKVLSKLSAEGFDIAIDDFGTGYSNLGQLQSFKCHTLKIDRSFVNEMEDGSVRATLIPHIVEIAKALEADTVAEGIENNLQLKALQDINIKYGQGWMFGRPMTFKKLMELYDKQH